MNCTLKHILQRRVNYHIAFFNDNCQGKEGTGKFNSCQCKQDEEVLVSVQTSCPIMRKLSDFKSSFFAKDRFLQYNYVYRQQNI